MKYFFPIHLDGGNRGCEGIARSSAYLLNKQKDSLVGYCRDIELDTRLGLSDLYTLVPRRQGSRLIGRFLGLLSKLVPVSKTKEWRQLYAYRALLKMVTKDDVVLFTGGDMMCYDDNELVYLNNWLHRHGVRTVLWGCSMGPENQTPAKLKTLKRFSYIYSRESLSQAYFQSVGRNACLLPDPAFMLDPKECQLPKFFQRGNLVGINVSNYTMGGMTLTSRFGKEVMSLIRYILDETELNIVLVPHVTWNRDGINQDDREMAQLISQHFNTPERIHVLDIDALNYQQIRYVISQLRLFMGARTHAVISAYSQFVPTIALGYSIKSRGIAKDLGLNEQLVVNSKDFAEGDLLRSFQYLLQNESQIRTHLKSIMLEYKERSYDIRELLWRNNL